MLAVPASHAAVVHYRRFVALPPTVVPIMHTSRFERRRNVSKLMGLDNKIVASSGASGPDTPDDSRSKEFLVPFWTGQVPHFLGVVALAASSIALARGADAFTAENILKSLMGTSSFDWFRLGLLVPIMHQMMVVVSWRVQLNYQSITKAFGKEGGKLLFLSCFAAFAITRAVATIATSISTSDVLWKQGAVSYAAAAAVALPAIYVLHSVFKYLGFPRLAGVDHFDPEYYRKKELVKEGAFKLMKNPIYKLGVLIMCVPGVATGSLEGLTLGLYQYLALWVLYFSIERADMAAIYKEV